MDPGVMETVRVRGVGPLAGVTASQPAPDDVDAAAPTVSGPAELEISSVFEAGGALPMVYEKVSEAGLADRAAVAVPADTRRMRLLLLSAMKRLPAVSRKRPC